MKIANTPLPLPLTVSPELLRVLASPGLATAGRCVVVQVATVDTAGLLAGSGETTALAVLYRQPSPRPV